jgi:hypothetical protein
MAAIVAPLIVDASELAHWRREMVAALERDCAPPSADAAPVCTRRPEPVLMQSIGTTNIVEFDRRYYALPQALGPVDFHGQDASTLPGVRVASNLPDLLTKVAAT